MLTTSFTSGVWVPILATLLKKAMSIISVFFKIIITIIARYFSTVDNFLGRRYKKLVIKPAGLNQTIILTSLTTKKT